MVYKDYHLIQFSKLLKNKDYYEIQQKSLLKLEKSFEFWIQLNDKWVNIKYILLIFDYPELLQPFISKTFDIEKRKKMLILNVSHPSHFFMLKTTHILISQKNIFKNIKKKNFNNYLTNIYYELW